VGAVEEREGDFFGPPVNRAARIMGVAHGGQMLVSQTARELVGERWPPGVGVLDLGSVRLRDLAAPQRLYQLVAPGLRTDFPALRSLEGTPTNLPQQLTSFVGRDEEVQALRAQLAHTRLVTLTGPGGIGKTRLALQAGAEVLDLFADGVWLVELATLASPDLVVPTVAGVLGVREQPGSTSLQALQAHLDSRQTLLILDNCEHMLEGVATLVEQLLGATTGLKVLATSREALRAAGERVAPLEPLAAPGAPGAASLAASAAAVAGRSALESLAALPAVRMFLDRAQAARPGFQLDEDNAEDVAEVCRSLDGLPLALELAAARLGTMSAAQLRARLDDRFRLLRGGRRLAPPRQQTLQALIDWSHDLLDADEQVLLRRLGVFAGSFPTESAQAVAAHGELEGADVEEMLAALAAKSLVVARPEEGRFLMLETLRAYARQRLKAAGEMEGVRERHTGVMLERLERHGLGLKGAGEAQALRALDADHADVLEALSWSMRSPTDGARTLGFVNKLYSYYPLKGRAALGLEQVQKALSQTSAQVETARRAFAFFVAGQYCRILGRGPEARQHFEVSLRMARQLGLVRYETMATNMLATVLHDLGDKAEALRYAQQSVNLAREVGDEQEIMNALGNLGMHLRGNQQLEPAREAFVQVLERMQSSGRKSPRAVVLLNLAMVTLDQGELAPTLDALEEALQLVDQLKSPALAACLLDVAAAASAVMSDQDDAVQLWERADSLYAACGLTRDGPDLDFVRRWRKAEGPSQEQPPSGRTPPDQAEAENLSQALALVGPRITRFRYLSKDPDSHRPDPAAAPS
jgi:predicted ATPase